MSKFFPLTNYRIYDCFRFPLRTGVTTYGKIRELAKEAKCQRKLKEDDIFESVGHKISHNKNIGAPISLGDLRGQFYIADGRRRTQNKDIPDETPARVDIYDVNSHDQIRELFFDLNHCRAMSNSLLAYTNPDIYNILDDIVARIKLAKIWVDVDREDVHLTKNQENYYNLIKYIMAYVKKSVHIQKPLENFPKLRKEISRTSSSFINHMKKLEDMTKLFDIEVRYLIRKPTLRFAWASAHETIGNTNLSNYFRYHFMNDYNIVQQNDMAGRNIVKFWVCQIEKACGKDVVEYKINHCTKH